MATIGAVVDTTALLLENRAVTGVNLRTAAREVDAQRTLTRQNQCGEPLEIHATIGQKPRIDR